MAKVTKKKAQKKYIENSVSAFETFGHTVMMAKRDDIWDFTTYYQDNDKYYAVWCTGNLDNQKTLIQVAKKQLDRNSIRLVLICLSVNQKDQEHADEFGYCLCTLSTLLEYGNTMLDAKKRSLAGNIPDKDHGKVIVLDK